MKSTTLPCFAAAYLLASTAGEAAPFFAYVPVPAEDHHGIPIVNPKTGLRKMDGFCLVWRTEWNLDDADVRIEPPRYYNTISFRVDPARRTLTVYELVAPNIVAIDQGSGWYPLGGQMTRRVNLTVPIYPDPKPEWPCSKETWDAILSEPARQYPDIVYTLPIPGGRMSPLQYRERQRQMACDNPQIAGNRQRCALR